MKRAWVEGLAPFETLTPVQLGMHRAWHASQERKFVALCGRRVGKSYWAIAECISLALRKPGAQIKYASQTAGEVREIVAPLMSKINEAAPDGFRPRFIASETAWEWPNGSRMRAAGCDSGNAERLRGTGADLCVVDEAGFIDDLDYILAGVLMPQTLTTGGRILIPSSPSRTAAHPFHAMVVDAQSKGALIKRTIYDADHLPRNVVDEYCTEAGGENADTWRREYLAEFVTDSTLAIITERPIIEHRQAPQHRDWYLSLDIGFVDLTVALLAWFDFEKHQIIVEHEAVLERANTAQVVAACKLLEEHADAPIRIRVADADPRGLADLAMVGYACAPPSKHDKMAAIGKLRTDIGRGRVVVNPRCKTLLAHLEHGVWNNRRTTYARSGTCGHFDAIDALLYLHRSVDWTRNPAPARDPNIRSATHFMGEATTSSKLLGMVRPERRH